MLLFLVSSLCWEKIGASECVVEFKQHVKVEKDASLIVREDITVESRGIMIRHGIYREFPTIYRWKGKNYRVGFKVIKVLKDGKPENWFIKKRRNGVRVYMGEKDILLPPGTYTYTLVYRTNRQLGFFKDHDELYWNVNGTGWKLPFMEVSSVITLPNGVPKDSIRYTAYTGSFGQRGRDYEAWVDDEGRVHFRTTTPLMAGENLTVVVGWPKGYVNEPGLLRRVWWILRDNVGLLILLLTAALITLYYVWAWEMVGKDPPKGTIMPEFKPPDGMSPAAVRYVFNMGYDNLCLVANLIDLAVKGALKIKEEGKGSYAIVKMGRTPQTLTKDEDHILSKILGTLKLRKNSYSRVLKRISDSLELNLAKLWGYLFRLNVGFVGLGVGLSVVGGIAAFLLGFSDILMQSALLFGSFMVFLWLFGKIFRHPPFIVQTLAFIPSFLIAMLIYGLIYDGDPLINAISFLSLTLIAFVNLFFGRYMAAPTKEGRRMMDRIEGFKMFLETAEKERLKALFPKDSVPRIFERFLPYALALGVAETWADKFAEDLKSMDYKPEWYEGEGYAMFTGPRSYVTFFDSMGSSMSDTIASATVPPSESSGFSGGGGGGFSGGGGGGGGGGGW